MEECHTPKTISNLHLIPKHRGMRVLTEASTYIEQAKSAENTQFSIVQDLRRVNAATQNIKKTVAKLPEQIFQRLEGKIVSSINANQPYWHLLLTPESRAYTCFFLKKQVLQFNRMVQGLTLASVSWDHAMEIIFSRETMDKIKLKLPLRRLKNYQMIFHHFLCICRRTHGFFQATLRSIYCTSRQ